jgi:hypothetical protein
LITSFELIDLLDSEKWEYYLNKLPLNQLDIYYTPDYYRLYEELGDGLAQCFVFEYYDGIALYPFLKNEINVLGYKLNKKYYDIQGAYGYNGVVASTNDSQFVDKFYQAFEEYCQNENIVAEFTRFHPLLNNKSFSEIHLRVIYDRQTIFIDLKDNYENLFNDFQRTTRKQIKRAVNRYQIEVKAYENDINQLNTFTDIYNETMDRVQSVPYLYFNKNYFKSLIENTKNVCFVAYCENKPIASILALYNQFYLHGHLGGALTDYLHMSPYSLIYSEMIKFGQRKGCRFFHLGGGVTSKDNDPLLQFKLNFSKSTVDFYIGKKIHDEKIYNEVVSQWGEKYPKKMEMYNNILLKYRF